MSGKLQKVASILDGCQIATFNTFEITKEGISRYCGTTTDSLQVEAAV
jgi:hypothetical protein